MMFTLPMLRALACNVSRSGVLFVFAASSLAHVFRPICPLVMWLLRSGLYWPSRCS